MSESINITLPLPPSANRIWRRFGNRMVMSTEYREWKADAAHSIAHQLGGHPPLEWFSAAVTMPPTRRDLDNSAKPLMDALEAGGAVINDSGLRCLIMTVDDSRRGAGTVLISIRPVAAPEKPKKARKK